MVRIIFSFSVMILICYQTGKMLTVRIICEDFSSTSKIFPTGKGNNLDIGAETLEFDIAAVLGRTVSINYI